VIKLEISLTEETAALLRSVAEGRCETQDELVEFLLAEHLPEIDLSAPHMQLENRPDWQKAIEQGRADIAAGRVIPHEEIEQWLKEHPE
jgi:predicted transcriptional regulator